MKNARILFFTMAFLIILGSCERPKNIDEPQHFVLSGLVTETDNTAVKIYKDQDELAMDSLKADGSFSFDISAKAGTYYSLQVGKLNFSLYLSPGDSTHLVIDPANAENNLLVTGDKINEINYLKLKEERIASLGFNDFPGMWQLPPQEYLHHKDSLMQAFVGVFDSLKVLRGVEPEFIALEDAYFKYQPLFFDYIYPDYHTYFSNTSADSLDFDREAVKAAAASIPDDQPELLAVRPVRDLLEMRIREWRDAALEADSTAADGPDGYNRLAYIAADSIFRNPEVRDYFKFREVKDLLDYMGPVKAQGLYDRFMLEASSDEFKNLLELARAKWAPIMPGNTVPEFSFVNNQDSAMSLSDLRGKLVYVDIWATWCGPCINEHPYWEKLKADYEGKAVAFVTLSIDNNPEPWKKMLVDKDMEGNQWYAPGAWRSDIATHFMVTSIPRFLLFDTEGRILDPTAERPSGDIREVLDMHLATVTTASS
jgi:thiol-disulfide isomerase/thioredoxin